MYENVRVVSDRHFVAPLTDEEHHRVKVQAVKANTKIKHWVGKAIRDKLEREEEI